MKNLTPLNRHFEPITSRQFKTLTYALLKHRLRTIERTLRSAEDTFTQFTNHVSVKRRAASILTRYSTALLYSYNKPTVKCICHCCHQLVLCFITCSRLICFFSLSTYPTLNATPVTKKKRGFQHKRVPRIEQSPSIPNVIMATRLMSLVTTKTRAWLNHTKHIIQGVPGGTDQTSGGCSLC